MGNPEMIVKEIYAADLRVGLPLPLVEASVSAGFPSPAEDHIEKKLDLNDLLIQHPSATFFVRVEGESMKDAGIRSGDLLIVDKAIQASDQSVVVAVLNGEFTVKRISKDRGRFFLIPENPDYSRIEVTEEMEFKVWGVVTNVIHSVK